MKIEDTNDDYIDISFITPKNIFSKDNKHGLSQFRRHEEEIDQK